MFADAATLSFDGSQHFRVAFDSPSRTEAEDWRLRFRTPRPSGLLLTTIGDSQSQGRVELDLEGGRLRFTQFAIDRPKVIPPCYVIARARFCPNTTSDLSDPLQTWFIGQGLNDNQWHQVSITRRGGAIRLTVDDEPPVQGTAPGTSTENCIVKKNEFLIQNLMSRRTWRPSGNSGNEGVTGGQQFETGRSNGQQQQSGSRRAESSTQFRRPNSAIILQWCLSDRYGSVGPAGVGQRHCQVRDTRAEHPPSRQLQIEAHLRGIAPVEGLLVHQHLLPVQDARAQRRHLVQRRKGPGLYRHRAGQRTHPLRTQLGRRAHSNSGQFAQQFERQPLAFGHYRTARSSPAHAHGRRLHFNGH